MFFYNYFKFVFQLNCYLVLWFNNWEITSSQPSCKYESTSCFILQMISKEKEKTIKPTALF